ncbi:MAG: hypothetical protein V9F03_11290 [Microthrixaceae bacterium]
MTAPGHKPHHRHEEWEYGSWEYASTDNRGRKVRAQLLQRTLSERRLRKAQDAARESVGWLSVDEVQRLESEAAAIASAQVAEPTVDLTDSAKAPYGSSAAGQAFSV